MANQEQVSQLMEGVKSWNKWRQAHPGIRPDLSGADLGSVYTADTAELDAVYRAEFSWGHTYIVDLSYADLRDADLTGAGLRGADLGLADLRGADLSGAYLDNVDLRGADLRGADLRGASLVEALVVDVRWDGVNLAVVNWEGVKFLGDENKARSLGDRGSYQRAVRANRQLAVVLRGQGLSEEADHFAYRAQVLQRVVLRLRGDRFGRYFFSLFLDLLAGYGYRPGRSVIAYLLVISSFAFGYYALTHFLHAQPYPLVWYEALVLSISAFHGRGFFQSGQSLGDPVTILASIEAVFGLIIEISFIATFTQRFFGR